jgi:hypothetical protein
MSLISVRVKRPDAAHHQDGRIYKTGEVFQMEEAQFKDTERGIPGFFERADPPMEQIKSKDLPQNAAPLKGPAKPAVQEPPEEPDVDPALKAAGIEDPNKSQIETMGGDPVDPAPVTRKKLDLKKK